MCDPGSGTKGRPRGRPRDRPNDNRTTGELFAAALAGDFEDDSAWDAVAELSRRGTQEVFECAMKHARSEHPVARARGLDVLAQLGAGKPDSDRPWLDESVAMAISHLRDAAPLVVHSAAMALAYLRTEAAIEVLIEHRHHSDPCVRYAVAVGVPGSANPSGLPALIELMDDEDDDVRDWATFGLGSATMDVEDSAEIREALRRRLADPYEDVRQEAIWGLELRKDPLALRTLLERLEAEAWRPGDEFAAAETLGLSYDTPVAILCQGLRDLVGH